MKEDFEVSNYLNRYAMSYNKLGLEIKHEKGGGKIWDLYLKN